MNNFKIIVYIILLNAIFYSVNAQPYYNIPQINNAELFNKGISNTVALLNSPMSMNSPVRILIYGQSISAQDWWLDVKKYLENKFLSENVVVINKSIGGFSSERLKLMVKNDVVSFYPDLILFHDYGNEEDYEKIIQIIRSRTTAEIAIQTDHMAIQNQEWHDKHSEIWLPGIAKKYGLGLIDIRGAWKTYLADNKLEIKDLLTDGVHLNDHGNYLMAGIIKEYFETVSDSIPNTSNTQTSLPTTSYTQTFTAAKDFSIKKNSLKFPFVGNRIDLVWNQKKKTGYFVDVSLDNKLPSNITSCYYYTRPAIDTTVFFLQKIGQLLAIDLTEKSGEENWELTITKTDSVEQRMEFVLKGSITGEDGRGSSDAIFTSQSEKIIIKPEYWFKAKEFAGFPWMKTGDILKWQVRSMCKDKISPASNITTIIQGIDNGSHQLQLKGKAVRNLESIKVYAPPIK